MLNIVACYCDLWGRDEPKRGRFPCTTMYAEMAIPLQPCAGMSLLFWPTHVRSKANAVAPVAILEIDSVTYLPARREFLASLVDGGGSVDEQAARTRLLQQCGFNRSTSVGKPRLGPATLPGPLNVTLEFVLRVPGRARAPLALQRQVEMETVPQPETAIDLSEFGPNGPRRAPAPFDAVFQQARLEVRSDCGWQNRQDWRGSYSVVLAQMARAASLPLQAHFPSATINVADGSVLLSTVVACLNAPNGDEVANHLEQVRGFKRVE